MFEMFKTWLVKANPNSANSHDRQASKQLPRISRKERKRLRELTHDREMELRERFKVIDLEPRIMLSASWVDAAAVEESAEAMLELSGEFAIQFQADLIRQKDLLRWRRTSLIYWRMSAP